MFYSHSRITFIIATLFLPTCYSFHISKNYYFHLYTLYCFIQFYLVTALLSLSFWWQTEKKLPALVVNIYSYKMLYFSREIYLCWLINLIREHWQKTFVTLKNFLVVKGWVVWVNPLKKENLWQKSFFQMFLIMNKF